MKYFIILIPLLFSCCKCFSQNVLIPDTSLNRKIYLLNSSSVVKNLGDQKSNIYEGEGLPHVTFINKRKKTYVILYGQPGANANKFACFEVGGLSQLKDSTKAIYFSGFDNIKTESGIHLGMTSQELITLKGRPNSQTKIKNNLKIQYKLDKSNGINFLNRYNMPIYNAEYTFINNKLVKFSFGFNYP